MRHTRIFENLRNIGLQSIHSVIRKYDYYFDGKGFNYINNPNSGAIKFLLFLNDGRLVSSSYDDDNTLKIWNNYELQFVFSGHELDIDNILILPDDRIVSSSIDKIIKIWNSKDGTLIKTLKGSKGFITSLKRISTQENNLIVSASINTMTIWNIDTEESLLLKGHTHEITDIGILSDNKIVSSSKDGTIKVWDQGKVIYNLEGHGEYIHTILILPDDTIVGGSFDETITVWKNGELITTLEGHYDSISNIILLPNNTIASLDYSQKIIIWNMRTYKVELEWDIDSDFIKVLPDGSIVTTNKLNTIMVLDNETSVITHRYFNRDDVYSMDVSGTKIAIGLYNGRILVWHNSTE